VITNGTGDYNVLRYKVIATQKFKTHRCEELLWKYLSPVQDGYLVHLLHCSYQEDM